MANEQVVDELVVLLKMDASQYDKADKAKNARVDATEKKEKRADEQREKRKKERKKEEAEEKRAETERRQRLNQTEKVVKSLGSTLKGFALTAAAVFGLGAGVGGIVNAITNLAGFETGLRRAAVSTGMSNREMQAWGATAKRLGADADAGAAAIAALAREQKQFNLTGQGPTMQALARLGVNVTPNSKPEDLLEQAQQIYRRSAPAQQQQIEATLSAQGVSDDLIVMIKSETDARAAYQRSLADSIEENKTSMAALNDAMTSLKQASLQLANVLAVAATPYIQEFSNWVHNLASDPHKVDAWLAKTSDALQVLGTVVVDLAKSMKDAWTVVQAIAHPVAHTADSIHDWLYKGTDQIKAENPGYATPPSLYLRRMLHSIGLGSNPDLNGKDVAPDYLKNADEPWNASSTPSPVVSSTQTPISAQDLMQKLVQRGMTPAQAMAATANAEQEAGAPGKPGMIDPGALNATSGAAGIFQWLGPRKAAFQQQFGIDPSHASIDQQLDFLFHNPTEIATARRAFAGGGSAGDLATRFNDIFEANGVAGEGLKRAQLANQLASQTAAATGNGTTTDGTTVNINGPVSVQANNPSEFIGGIQRLAMVQNYNSANR